MNTPQNHPRPVSISSTLNPKPYKPLNATPPKNDLRYLRQTWGVFGMLMKLARAPVDRVEELSKGSAEVLEGFGFRV